MACNVWYYRPNRWITADVQLAARVYYGTGNEILSSDVSHSALVLLDLSRLVDSHLEFHRHQKRMPMWCWCLLKVPSEARSAGAPRGWSLGRGAVAPPQYCGLGA